MKNEVTNLKENKGRVNGRVLWEEREGENSVSYRNLTNKNNLKCALIIPTPGSFCGHCQLTLDGFENVLQIFLLFCMTPVILPSVLDTLNGQ